jgi:2-polyprenyl-6-methoxyphenol hydroxylase-like FAD-dependent oxidoreductase
VIDDSSNRSDPGRGTSAALHVLVIGGGIGGLCLGQGRSGISVAVYERDESPRLRSQGYRLSLKETGAGALHDCLPENLFDLCVATSIRHATRTVFTDQQLTPKFAKPIPHVEPACPASASTG